MTEAEAAVLQASYAAKRRAYRDALGLTPTPGRTFLKPPTGDAEAYLGPPVPPGVRMVIVEDDAA